MDTGTFKLASCRPELLPICRNRKPPSNASKSPRVPPGPLEKPRRNKGNSSGSTHDRLVPSEEAVTAILTAARAAAGCTSNCRVEPRLSTTSAASASLGKRERLERVRPKNCLQAMVSSILLAVAAKGRS